MELVLATILFPVGKHRFIARCRALSISVKRNQMVMQSIEETDEIIAHELQHLKMFNFDSREEYIQHCITNAFPFNI